MNRIILSTTLALAATPFAMHGEDSTDNPNRFFFGPRFGMNFKADFRNNASYFNAVNPGPVAGGADHTYNDGYVLVDSSGNAGGLTWNWGYQNSSQVVGNTVAMQFHAIQSSSPSSATDNPQYGAELVYQRVIGHLPSSSGCWGLETGFGFTDLDLRENRSGTVSVTTDTFQLNGVLPPSAGYNGTFSGPGALLGDTPTRTTESAALTSNQKLSGQLFSIRLGPFAELNFTPKLSFDASVGLTLAPTTLDYDFSETVALAGGGTFAASGHSSKTELLYGPYVGGMLRYAFNKCWGVYVGAQFQNLTDLEQSVGGHTARLDPGATVYGTVGVSWSF
ncbi:MAG: hypothetical protein ABSD57_12045 [Verrucomicrobiota bacterium]|jgi:hypothetical protein